jgi:hypothetical protein
VLNSRSPRRDGEETIVKCQVCKGSGVCPHCGGEPKRQRNCGACYYSGRCNACGGKGEQAIGKKER